MTRVRRRWRLLAVVIPAIAALLLAGPAVALAHTLNNTYQSRLPLIVYLELQHDPESAIVLSLVLLVVSLGTLFLLRDRWLGRSPVA